MNREPPTGGFFHARYNTCVRRLARILLNALTILSVLLCLAFTALWVRSYWVLHNLTWYESSPPGAERRFVVLTSGGGGASVGGGFYVAGFRWDARGAGRSEWYTHDRRPISYAGGNSRPAVDSATTRRPARTRTGASSSSPTGCPRCSSPSSRSRRVRSLSDAGGGLAGRAAPTAATPSAPRPSGARSAGPCRENRIRTLPAFPFHLPRDFSEPATRPSRITP